MKYFFYTDITGQFFDYESTCMDNNYTNLLVISAFQVLIGDNVRYFNIRIGPRWKGKVIFDRTS